MFKTRCTLGGLLLALVVGSPLQATVFLTYDATPLAGGAVAYDLYFNDDSATEGTWFAQNWTFSGDIKQTLAFSITPVSKEADANNYDALQFAGSLYKKLEDTWVGGGFTAFPSDTSQIPPPPNPLEQPGLFSVTAGSDAANKLSKVLFVHLVADGPISYSGSIARTGVDGLIPFSGVLAVPEPSSVVLGGLGALAVGFVAMRRRKSTRRQAA
jgi:hypothetical protein